MNLLLKVHKLNNEDVIATSTLKVTFTFNHNNGDSDTFTVDKGTTWNDWLQNNADYVMRGSTTINCVEHSGIDAHFYVGDLTGEITAGQYDEEQSF